MDPSSAADWAQWGVLGLLVLGFIVGWVVPGRIHDRALDRADRLEAENNELRDRIENRVLPLVHDAIAALDRHARKDG